MNGRLAVLNLALAMSILASGYKLRQNYLEDQAERQAFLRRQVAALVVPAAPLLAGAKPIQASTYLPVAERLLFSKDRNSNVIIEVVAAPPPPPPPPVPPFPAAFGMIGFGGEVVVLLADTTGKQKGYHLGDAVGPFKLSGIRGDELTLEWNGQEFKKSVTELKKLQAPTAAAEAAGASREKAEADFRRIDSGNRQYPPPTTPEQREQILRVDRGPGLNIGGPDRACDPNDKAPAGTVQGGFRKVVTPSPFGGICIWEPVR
jgi:hypothetical protein